MQKISIPQTFENLTCLALKRQLKKAPAFDMSNQPFFLFGPLVLDFLRGDLVTSVEVMLEYEELVSRAAEV